MSNEKYEKLVMKGDKAVEKNKLEKALEFYRNACELNPEDPQIYDKLITTHNKLTPNEWNDTDFAESLAWTMKKQELENPQLKRVHARMEPEWQQITQLIKQMTMEPNEKKETEIIEKIVSYGELALYPLIESILSFKELNKKLKNTEK